MITHMDPETSWASIDHIINRSSESLLLSSPKTTTSSTTTTTTTNTTIATKLSQQRPSNCYIYFNQETSLSSSINYRTNLRKNAILLLVYCCFFCITYASAIVVTNDGQQLPSSSPSIQQQQKTQQPKYTTVTTIVQDDVVMLKNIQENVQLADEEEYFEEEELDEYQLLISNKTAKGVYIGGPCDDKCDTKLHHAYCDKTKKECSCLPSYPVVIGLTKGCAKPKRLGEQCFYHQTCLYNDPNSLCVQVKHNALCQCASGYHSVTYSKPVKKIFCTQDMAALTSDLPTLLGVSTGIAVLAGLICMVLHLFSKTKYPRHRNFGDANIPPPIMYSTDTVHSARPSSRGSIRSSNSISSYCNRRPSSAPQSGSKGVLVSTSRSGSRRPSLASINSTTSSVRSYSTMRIEKELQQKEIRQEMKLRLVRLQQQQHNTQMKPHIIVGGDPLQHISGGSQRHVIMSASNPITPISTDELLPSVDETLELSPPISIQAEASYIGPCSSNEALLE